MGSAILTNAIATTVSAVSPSSNNWDVLTRLSFQTSPEYLSYIFFSRPFPLGATILSAKLHFYTQTMGTGTHTFTFQRLNQAFSASKVTYNTRPFAFIGGTKAVTMSGSQPDFEPWELDVTDWMQSVSSGQKWYGWRIINNEATLRYIYSENYSVAAYRPRLEVTWSDAPDTPGGLSPSGGRAVGLAKPVVKAVYRDVSGSTQLANVQVQINATDSWGAPSFDSGTVATSVPELDLATTAYAGLADLATTFWRIRFQDAAGIWSAYSTAASFMRDDKGVLTVNNPPLGSPAQGTAAVSGWMTAVLGTLLPSVGGTPPVWQAVTQQTSGTGTTSVCTYPGTISANDILLWQQYIEPDGTTVTAPDGTWTKIAEVDQPGDGTADFRVQWWYKRAAGGETGSVTFTHASSFRRASLHRFNGVITTGNPFEAVVSAANLAVSVLTPILGLSCATDRLMVWGASNFTGAGQSWTPPAGYTERLDASEGTSATKVGAVTLPIVEDATPPIFWTFTGETQAAYQIQITHVANNVRIIDWDSGKITSTTKAVTVPAGKINEPTLTTYLVTVRVWDTKQREATPGDPTYVEIVREFTFVPGSATGTTSLTAVPDTSRPKVVLTWQAATTPDQFNILRNGKVIAGALSPVDLFVSGTTYTYTDQSPSPGRVLTYEVQRVVNGVASASNDTEPATVNTKGIWLRELTSGLELFIAGNDDHDFTLGKQTAALKSIAQNANTVLINQSLGGLEVPISGQLISMHGLTAQQWRDQYIQMRNLRVKKFWLTVGDYTFQVVCDFENYGRRGVPENVFKVGFMAYQQDSLTSILLGS